MTMTRTRGQRLDKGALFEALGYDAHPGQLRVHRSTAPRRVLACGVRFGKSMCAGYECVAALMEPREQSLGWVVAPTYDLSERVFRQVVAIIRKHFAHRVKECNERERRLIVFNLGGGISELRGKSADNRDSLLGEGLDYLVVDEAARLDRAIWDEHLSQRVIDRAGWVLLLSTPQGTNWFYGLFRRGQSGRDPQFESWASPSTDNPHLDPAAIEAERARLATAVFEVQYQARFIGAENEPCERCEPDGHCGSGMVFADNPSELARCLDCDGYVDQGGRALALRSAGRVPTLTLVSIQPRPGGGEVLIEFRSPDQLSANTPLVLDGGEHGLIVAAG
jgi:hypothetical protein